MKIPRAAILMLALPVSLAAQQPSGGQPANPITSAFRGRVLALHRNLAQAFDSIPERLFSYKPTPAQLTIGYIAQLRSRRPAPGERQLPLLRRVR